MKYSFTNREKDLYNLRRTAQLAKWANNMPEHNTTDNECTPDFGCCNPKLLAPLEERKQFYDAIKANHQHIIRPMLVKWMQKLIDLKGLKNPSMQIKK